MHTHLNDSVPTWLVTPPSSQVKLPSATRLQELPFQELAWEDFEKLCLRLAKLEANVEHCQLYGERGDNQEGIDLYTRKSLSEKYTVYQCKREKNFGPAKIGAAVSKFLKGSWVNQTNVFVLCTQESLKKKDRADKFKAQSEVLHAQGISFIKWDSDELSIKLKDHPKIVDDFFGRAWVVAFCGQDQADELVSRLDALQVIEYRSKLAVFYRRVFNTNDPGLPTTILDINSSLPLERRYVLPDVRDRRSFSVEREKGSISPQMSYFISEQQSFYPNVSENYNYQNLTSGSPKATASIDYQQRQLISKWLANQSRSIILGSPGSGKSAFLRFLATDLFQEAPQINILAQKWGQFLPVWVSFAWWTKMIHQSIDSPCSLSEMLQAWFRSWDEERLFPLVEKALLDERLLLLVDGLDEWANEDAARIALDRLQVFIEQRDIPAIAVSRPQGFEKLSVRGGSWTIGELSSFSPQQQNELAKIWFSFRALNITQDSTTSEEDIQRIADFDTASFMAELSRSTDLYELAKTPLLLCLLIALAMSRASLPQRRFKAYDQLVEYLIHTHPQMRRRAASLTNERQVDLSDDDLKKIIAYLAYRIRGINRTGTIESEQAVKEIEDYLKDPSGDFDLAQNQARLYSRTVLDVGENTIGLLVKQSPNEIGFFHRAFWEYLSSYHLSRLALTQQKEFLENFCIDPQAHEVILGLLQISNRSQDVRELVLCLQTKLECVQLIDQFAVKLLLSEIAFGEFNCPPNVAKEIAADAFKEIEFGFWMPHRERLLKNVFNGLRSTPLKETVKAKLKTWFPCQQRWRENIFQAISHWSPTPETIEILWKGLHDEEMGNKRAAAKSLAVIAQEDGQIADRLIKLANNALADPYTCAVAIDSLLNGWLSHEAMDNLLAAVRYSASPELRLVAICGRIAKQTHTQEDHTELLQLGGWNGELDYHWKHNVTSALLNGWTQAPNTKTACLESLQAERAHPSRLDPSIALRVLLAGYPQDEEVAEFCINQIRHQEYPFVGTDMDFQVWRLLSQNFRDHTGLAETIDEWLMRSELSHRAPEVSFAALLGRTAQAKAKLLSSLNSWVPHWSANALIEGWGIEDPEVAETLTQMLLGSADSASQISHIAPLIISNSERCRHRLLEILRDPKCSRHDLVISGLTALDETQSDIEVIDCALELIPNLTLMTRDSVVLELFKKYSFEPRVRNLAKQELSQRIGDNVTLSLNATIAWAYKNDDEIKRQVLQSICPLPTQLRRIIAISLSDNSYDDEFSLSMLKLYDHDHEAEIKTQASIGYHTLSKRLGRSLETDIETLSQNITCGGIDLEARRQAAFSGLVVLNRLDVVVNAKEHNEKPCQVPINHPLYLNPPLLKLILENWQDVKVAFGKELWSRLTRDTQNPGVLWTQLSLFADEYPIPCNELIEFLDSQSDRPTDPNILRFLGRTRPKSNLLLEYCLDALAGQNSQYDPSGERILVAAELLGENFRGDSIVLERILSNVRQGFFPPFWVIMALAEGWYDSDEFGRLSDQVLQVGFEENFQEEFELNNIGYFALVCRKGTSNLMFNFLSQVFQQANSRSYIRDHSLIVRRLQTDEQLLVMLNNHLQNSPSTTEKATIPGLIARARGLPPELRHWCFNEVNAQLQDNSPPLMGIDLIARGIRPITHSLLDVLLK